MALPITVPFTFANATTTQNLSSLDADFLTVYNAVNGIGNGSVSLSNVSITGGSITGASVNANVTLTSVDVAFGNIANFSSNTAMYATGKAYSTLHALTDASSITVDLSVGNNFYVTLGGNRILSNPTNATAGQSGIVYISQDSTGSRTLSYGSNWRFPGNTAPTLTTTANAVDVIVYTVFNSSSITAQAVLNVG